ncbi:hypothetical protein EHZ47_09070 [Aeromonas jandaei]|uniref:hypothetical protein n=1 Tax=Aeromonas jandaei TaxID=650 RepID=UPI000F520E58|nr:hypothetical protein [Aeromonas jandaei]RQM76197.1 hypothetical protein EHZ47_09070 [Aeromonas jandaei]
MASSLELGSVSDLVSMATSLGTFVVGCCAFATWKSQVILQDRYEKADDLLRSYRELMQAGHNMHWHRFGSEEVAPIIGSSELSVWQTALFKYRGSFTMAQLLFSSELGKDHLLEPDRIQREVLALGRFVRDRDSLSFSQEISKMQSNGIAALQQFKLGRSQ